MARAIWYNLLIVLVFNQFMRFSLNNSTNEITELNNNSSYEAIGEFSNISDLNIEIESKESIVKPKIKEKDQKSRKTLRLLAQDYYSKYYDLYKSYYEAYLNWYKNLYIPYATGYYGGARFPPNSQVYDMNKFLPPIQNTNGTHVTGNGGNKNSTSGNMSKLTQSPPAGRLDVPYLFGHPIIFNGAVSPYFPGLLNPFSKSEKELAKENSPTHEE